MISGEGRQPDGKFGRGNRCAVGNPLGPLVQRLRVAMLKAVKPRDIRDIARTLLELAKRGNLEACRLLLDRCLGPPLPADVLERLERLEGGVTDADTDC